MLDGRTFAQQQTVTQLSDVITVNRMDLVNAVLSSRTADGPCNFSIVSHATETMTRHCLDEG